ncbi:MAG: hypothetical protein ACE15C_15780 [Phycisphaerae bacterium]
MEYGHFDDAARAYVVTNPLTPRPWINYIGNGRLQAFISQTAGGLMWYLEPESRRLSRYHYLAGPADRPGFWLYVKDNRTGTIWNPPITASASRTAAGDKQVEEVLGEDWENWEEDVQDACAETHVSLVHG